MAGVSLRHAWDNRLGNVQQAFHIDVDHGIPVVYITCLDRIQTMRIASVVYQHRNF